MIIGTSQVILANHPKPESLDVWIRTHENVSHQTKTCQAINNVINQLIKHKPYSFGLRKCPESKRISKALVICDNKKYC